MIKAAVERTGQKLAVVSVTIWQKASLLGRIP